MNDAVDVGVFGEDFVKGLLVCDVEIIVFRAAAADELYPVEDFAGGIVEIVDYHDVVVGFEEGKGCEGADVARAAGNGRSVIAQKSSGWA